AAVVEWESGIGRGQDGVVEEAQPRMPGAALVGVVIEIELACFEEPVVLSRLAGGEARVDQTVFVAADKFDALGGAARRALALQEKPRALEETGVVEHVVIHRRTEEAVDAALQPHAAFAFELAELAVVAQELAEDAELTAPDLGRAARGDFEIAHRFDLLRVDGSRIGLRQR